MLTDADVVILSLLAESPRHGYDLDRLIEQRGYRRWTSLAFSSIYYVLRRLEDRGLIEPAASDGGRRTVFQPTDAGREQLREGAARRIGTPDPPSAGVLPALGAYATLDDPELQRHLARRAATLSERIVWLQTASRAAEHPTARAIFEFELARHRAELSWTRAMADPHGRERTEIETQPHRQEEQR